MPMNPRLMRPRADSRAEFPHNPNNLVLVFDTSKQTANLTVSVPINNVSGSPNVTIDWGDGTTSTATTNGFVTKTYASAGIYIVQVSGTMTRLSYGTGDSTTNNKEKLIRCLSFGNLGITQLNSGFRNCPNLIQCPVSLPTTSSVTTLSGCFNGCTSFNDARVSGWNTAAVTSMFAMFQGATAFNQDIGSWNTAAVTSMSYMLYGATAFNQNIGSWNLAAVQELDDILTSSGLQTANYDAILIGWEQNKSSFSDDLYASFGNTKYSAGAAATARAALVTYGWAITDGGQV